jgi:hypothetical protein
MNKSIYYIMLILLILILISTSILLISDIKENFTTKLNNNNLSFKELISRLLSDNEFKKELYNKIPNNTTQISDSSNKFNKLYDFDAQKYNEINTINTSLDNLNNKLPDKYNKIIDEVKILSARYNKNRHLMEEILHIDKSYDTKEFNKKNLLLKEKLQNLKELKNNSLEKQINNSNIVILKNIYNNYELMIEKVTMDAFKTSLYQIRINDKCLLCDTRTSVKVEECTTINDTMLFYLVYIKSNSDYNKYILESNTNLDYDLIYTKENIYPFYMLIPFNINGYAIYYRNNNNERSISISPIRNNPLQRFKRIIKSTACPI